MYSIIGMIWGEKMKKLLKNKKKVILIVVLIIFAVLLILFVKSFFASQDRVYGNRLEGASKVNLSKSTMEEMANVFKDVPGVTKTSYRENGKIIHLLVDVSANTDFNKLKEVSSKVRESLNKSQKTFYDVEVFFFGDGDIYPVIGYLHKSEEEFVWSNNVND